ncbi:hypothetical protein [Saccharomonospora sp.]|uniref:hypothetical protein n=1 Tax=Saccharomonospora sp. TaxID=33913 RepID=UPI002311208B|nr:hypothetical protein [Saccharomonospora sp.]MDA8370288.1 hypothetical protein [Nocardiopsaceae bacterium]
MTKERAEAALFAECAFTVREPAEDGQFHYERIWVDGRESDGRIHTAHPPVVGDIIGLRDRHTGRDGMFEVVMRQWSHAGYLSAAWPYGDPRPNSGPMVEIIVVPAEGVFRNAAPIPDDEDQT